MNEDLAKRLQRVRRPALLGTLRRTRPLSDFWGRDRGMPIDRYYIESFLQRCREDIRGRVLEVRDGRYTNRYGHDVEALDILDRGPDNPGATMIADLEEPEAFPRDEFDCVIATQTLQYVFDVDAAIRSCHRLLRPGGVLLATVPAVSRIPASVRPEGDFWRFTGAACERLVGDVFGDRVAVTVYGNVLVAVAFLVGMAKEELSRAQLDEHDEYFPVLVAVRAQKT